MFSLTSRLNFTRTLGSMMMLGIMLFLCTTYVYAGQVSLAWDANTESTLGGYELHYGQTSGNYTANVDVGNTTSYTLASLQDGATYYFALKAHDTTGTIWSDFSNEVSTTIPTSSTAPVANFTASPTSGTAPLTVTFTDSSTGSITTWSWVFGDGTTGTGKTAVKTYTNPGTYTASLTVTGPGGSNTKTQTISATAAAPVANFSATPTTGTAPLSVTFTNSSTGTVTSYSWNFGDGSTSTSTTPAHTYSTAGTFTVSLTATGSGGTNTKTLSSYITVSTTTGGGGTGTGGLVSAYDFEEVSGSQAVDASGQGNHGTLSGTSRITKGKFGKALSFDGINDWVTVNDSNSLDLTTGMTLEAWVYPTVFTSGWRTILHKEVDRYFLMAGSDSETPAGGGTLTTGMKIAYAGQSLSVNTWAHLAVTYDSASVRLYINGTQVASQAQTEPLTTSSGALRIGGTQAYGEYFQGRIDEVRVYNRALSAAEISTDMNTSVATSSPSATLVGTSTIGSVADSLLKGMAQAFQTEAAVTGWATSLSVYVDTGSNATSLVAGIYADNNGHPGTLLVQGTLRSPGSGGWKNVAIPPASLTAGTKYWIAILSPIGKLKFRDEGGFVGGLSETNAQSALTTLPSTWTTGAQVLEGPVSAYGVGHP